MKVFRITTEIARQCFPVTLDVDHPGFLRGMQRLLAINERIVAAKTKSPGLWGKLKVAGLMGLSGLTLLRVYLLPPKHAPLPAEIRVAPSW
jgi:magnesium-protoporphyrin IX monomethyl ester (oxidative) cyclase